MNICDTCGLNFKTAQGLAGHRRLRHRVDKMANELEAILTSKQMHRKIVNHLSEKLAEKLAEVIFNDYGQELLDFCLAELSSQGLDLLSLGKYKNMKAIIVAAGANNRLLPLIQNKPVCLLEIGSKTIMDRELENLKSCGITDITVIRGYQGDKIDCPSIRYYDNLEYRNTGILKSLFHAEDEMENGFLFCYSDIVFQKEVLELLLKNQADISLVIDTSWRAHYNRRYQRPVSEAELVKVEIDRITQIGKNIIPLEEVHGEFIGLAKFSTKGAKILKDNYELVMQKYPSGAFHNAPSLDKAYFTDMLQEIIDEGYPIHYVDIHGGWAEIDNPEDINYAIQIS